MPDAALPKTVARGLAARALVALKCRPFVKQILDGLHATGLRLATTALTLLFGILGARLLGADVFGGYVSLMAVAGLVATATSVGLPALVTREIAVSRGSGDSSGLPPLAQGLLLVNGLLLVGALLLFVTGRTHSALVLTFALAGNGAGLLAALFAGRERILFASWLNGVLRPLGALAALVVLTQLFDPSIELPLLAQVAGACLATLALIATWQGGSLVLSLTAVCRAPKWSAQHRTMLRAGVVFASTQILINLTTQIDILILTAMTDAETVAQYYAAARAALVVSFFFGSVAMLAEPTLARLYAGRDMEALRSKLGDTARTGLTLTLACVLGAIAFGPLYLGLYGPGFASAYPSMIILLGGLVAWSFFGPAQVVLRAVQLEDRLLSYTFVAVCVNAGVTAALVPWLGPAGAALGTALQFTLYGALMSRCVRKEANLRTDALSAFATRRATA